MKKLLTASLATLLAAVGTTSAQRPGASLGPPQAVEFQAVPAPIQPPVPARPAPAQAQPTVPARPAPAQAQPTVPSQTVPTTPVFEREAVLPGVGEPVVFPSRGNLYAGDSFWIDAEFLLWWTKNSPVPVPLLTTSNVADGGVIGNRSTVVLIGADDVDQRERFGGRFTLGGWLDTDAALGVEGTYFFLGARTASETVEVPGSVLNKVIAVPFLDVNPASQGERSALVSSPNAFSGTASLFLTNRQFQGAEANAVCLVRCGHGMRLDALAGFRFLQLEERLTFRTSSPDFPLLTDDVFDTEDRFGAENFFYGGQLGARLTYEFGRLSVSSAVKVALGVMRQEVSIEGSTVTNDFTGSAGEPTTFTGGYFAQGTNIGNYDREVFSVVPEFNINLGLRVTDWARLTFGYTFLYAANVARPGEQIDRVINSSQGAGIAFNPDAALNGPARPTHTFVDSGFWAQGLNFGVEFRY